MARRALQFLRILTETAGATAIRDTLVDGVKPTAVAEHPVKPTPRRKVASSGLVDRISVPRIDLMFEWPVGMAEQRAVVVVEAKLGATVNRGQLKPYREEARRRAYGGPTALILLSARADEAEARHRAWRPVRWVALMRRWEAVLAEAGDTDDEFARLRAQIWRSVLL